MVEDYGKSSYTTKPAFFKPHFVDGKPATSVKPEMSESTYKQAIEYLKEANYYNFNNGAGRKGGYPSGDDLMAVLDSTTRVSPSAPGVQCTFRTTGINEEDPDASYGIRSSYVDAQRINLYC